jgi:DoxX-like family
MAKTTERAGVTERIPVSSPLPCRKIFDHLGFAGDLIFTIGVSGHPGSKGQEAAMRQRVFWYWVFMALTALWLVSGGILDLMRAPAVAAILRRLGYPIYVCTILGSCKILAVAALLRARNPLLRECAYAGITFLLMGAFLSHLAVHDTVGATAAPVTLLALAAGSYLVRPAHYRLRARPTAATQGAASFQA